MGLAVGVDLDLDSNSRTSLPWCVSRSSQRAILCGVAGVAGLATAGSRYSPVADRIRNQTSIHKAAPRPHRTSSTPGPSAYPPCPTPLPPRPKIRPRRRSTPNNSSNLHSPSYKTPNFMLSFIKIPNRPSQIPLGSVCLSPSLIFALLLPQQFFSPFLPSIDTSKSPSRKACMYFLSFWEDSLQRDTPVSGICQYLHSTCIRKF
jgi:hypothetical protein